MSDVLTPIDRYLAEQRSATAVDAFSRDHDAGTLEVVQDAGRRVHRRSLPLERPGPGQQWAFRVDLDACTGCKACVSACHSLNGLDEGESWRTVGELVGTAPGAPLRQSVPSGCHHCLEPACLSGCPTNAYEKDPWTGIVRHLDDQCFGCGYCELTCPYEVPRMNARLGIVRKCDLCADRLAEGEAPACVQGCPTEAIAVDVVDVEEVRADAEHGGLVPGAPPSSTTAPTTRYVGRELPEGAVAADHHALHPSHAHPPLALMLVLTQCSVGALVLLLLAGWLGGAVPGGTAPAVALSVIAVGASIAHLGRPLVAWRAVLGVGHSWLSREIVAFGAHVALGVAHVASDVAGLGPAWADDALGGAAAVAGLAGVACSAQLYAVTRRTWWALRRTGPLFTGTLGAGGAGLATASTTTAAWSTGSAVPGWTTPVAIAAAAVLAAKLALEARSLRPAGVDGPNEPGSPADDLARTARLLRVPLAASTRIRAALGVVGVAACLATAAATAAAGTAAVGGDVVVLAVAASAVLVAGELVERWQFFVASVAPRMPGGFRR